MRLVKFLLIIALALATRLGYAQQGQSEEPFATSRDLSKSVHIYPNPASSGEYMYVKVADLPAEKIKVVLHNIIGNKMEIETEVYDINEIRVRIKDLASGYYMVSVKDNNSRSFGIFKWLKR
jgi:hypothetical protein